MPKETSPSKISVDSGTQQHNEAARQIADTMNRAIADRDRLAALKAELVEALEKVLPPLHGIHGGPLVQLVATYEDGSDEDTARHRGRVSHESVEVAYGVLARARGES